MARRLHPIRSGGLRNRNTIDVAVKMDETHSVLRRVVPHEIKLVSLAYRSEPAWVFYCFDVYAMENRSYELSQCDFSEGWMP